MTTSSSLPSTFTFAAVAIAIMMTAGAQRVLAFPPRSSPSSSNNKLHVNPLQIRGGALLPKPPLSALFMTSSRRKFLAGIGGSILSLPIGAEIYSRLGSSKQTFSTKYPNEPFDDIPPGGSGPDSWNDIEEVTLVFHGAAGQDQYTDELMTNLAKTTAGGANNNKSYQAMVDWSDLSQNILQASFNGQRVGRETASRLLAKCAPPNLKTVHLIGISVGAFAADACCVQLKESLAKQRRDNAKYDNDDGGGDDDAPSDVFVQLTLLDPFQQRGVLGTGYGSKNFGKMADYAQQYLNTDDPVPSTNEPLKHCHVVDITGLRPEEIFGHDWPVIYYARSGGRLGLVPAEERRDAGVVDVA